MKLSYELFLTKYSLNKMCTWRFYVDKMIWNQTKMISQNFWQICMRSRHDVERRKQAKQQQQPEVNKPNKRARKFKWLSCLEIFNFFAYQNGCLKNVWFSKMIFLKRKYFRCFLKQLIVDHYPKLDWTMKELKKGKKKTGFCFVLKMKLRWNASYNFWEKSELFWASKWTKMSLYFSSKIDAG